MTYSLSFMLLLLTLLSVLLTVNAPKWLFSWTLFLAPPVHMFVQLRAAYRVSWWSAAWRTLYLLFAALTVLILFVLAASVVNLAIPGPWEAVLVTDTNAAESRSFLPSLVGPFTHPLDLGQFTALSFVALAAWRVTVRRTTFTLVLLVASGLGALATARRTAIGSVVAMWLWLQAKMRTTAVLVALLVFFFFDSVFMEL